MGLIGINAHQPKPQGKDALDRIAQGLQIAQGVLGVGLAIPEYLQKRDLAKAEKEKNVFESSAKKVDVLGKTTEANETEKDSVFIPGIGYRKPKKEVDYDEVLKKSRVVGLTPLIQNKELYDYVKQTSPDIADIPGITVDDARGELVKKSSVDPRLELALKSFDLQLKNFSLTQQKQEKQDYKARLDDLRSRINKIKDPEIETLNLTKRAEDQIEAGSTIGFSTAAAIIAKSVGKDTGALTEGDIKRYLPQTLWSSALSALNYLTGQSQTPLSPEVQSALNVAVKTAAKSIRRDLAFKIQDEIDQYTASDHEFSSKDEVKKYFMSLGRQIKGLDKATLIRRLEDESDLNPDRSDEIKIKIKQIEDTF